MEMMKCVDKIKNNFTTQTLDKNRRGALVKLFRPIRFLKPYRSLGMIDKADLTEVKSDDATLPTNIIKSYRSYFNSFNFMYRLFKFTMKPFIISGILCLIFLVLTGILAFFWTIPGISDICFYFHLIPFGIGFAGGSNFAIGVYYFVVWLVFTILFGGIAKLYS